MSTSGEFVEPMIVPFKEEWLSMSSTWKDSRVQPWNPIKTTTYNANWGQGAFTCIHTLNDDAGPWW
jgi:hypothetical protein